MFDLCSLLFRAAAVRAAIAIVSALMMIAAAGTPAAAEEASVTPANAAKAEAADQGLGMALLSAVVAFDGTLVGGAGAVSSLRFQTGAYIVEFERNVLGCARAVTAGNEDPAFPASASGFATAPRNGNVNALFVRAENQDGLLANQDFHVIVFCAN